MNRRLLILDTIPEFHIVVNSHSLGTKGSVGLTKRSPSISVPSMRADKKPCTFHRSFSNEISV